MEGKYLCLITEEIKYVDALSQKWVKISVLVVIGETPSKWSMQTFAKLLLPAVSTILLQLEPKILYKHFLNALISLSHIFLFIFNFPIFPVTYFQCCIFSFGVFLLLK